VAAYRASDSSNAGSGNGTIAECVILAAWREDPVSQHHHRPRSHVVRVRNDPETLVDRVADCAPAGNRAEGLQSPPRTRRSIPRRRPAGQPCPPARQCRATRCQSQPFIAWRPPDKALRPRRPRAASLVSKGGGQGSPADRRCARAPVHGECKELAHSLAFAIEPVPTATMLEFDCFFDLRVDGGNGLVITWQPPDVCTC